MRSAETIFAPASGVGRAAVAVIRVSGPQTAAAIAAIAGPLPEARRAKLMTFRHPVSAEALDRGLLLWFPAPRSFTGEDCAEFHVHGGSAVVAALCDALIAVDGLRPADPGEFTRRAFENGKLDLAEVEGLADLIEAQTERQRRQALRQLTGALSGQTHLWRKALIEAAALIEAEIDFSDEGDVPALTAAQVAALLDPVTRGLADALAASRRGERLREGLIVLIAGPPNAGKSTLLNVLARRDVAIVSPLPGTTRDTIEVALDLDGIPVVLIDTAGLRDSADPIESMGIARALKRAKEADLVLWLSEAAAPVPVPEGLVATEIWPIFSKSDATAAVLADAFSISAQAGQNLDRLIARLQSFASTTIGDGHAALITRERHRLAFQRGAAALARVSHIVHQPIELVAEDLRVARRALESVIGLVDVEEVLGEIFSRFCIGK